MALDISSGTARLLHISDAVLSPLHLEQPEWYPLHDVMPEKAMATKRLLLDWVAAEKLLVFAFHFPFPGLGYVDRKAKGWQWRPIAGI